MVIVSSPRALEFACHSAACAPPPAGTGGSGGGGRSGRPVRPNPIGPGAGRNPNQGMINKTIKDAEARAASQVRASDLKRGDKVVFAQKVRTVSSIGKQNNGKVGISFKDGGITDLRPGQTLPRASSVKVKTRKGTESPYDDGEGPSRDKGSGGPSDARKYPGTK